MPTAQKNLPLLDIDILRTFVTIAETGNFTQAAKLLAKTPAAVSLQIKRLEQLLGQTLFTRAARQSSLTVEGETLLAYSRRLLQLNHQAVAQFLTPALTGAIKLGVPDNVGSKVLPAVLAQFAHSHPALQVDVTIGASNDLITKLDRDQLDIALVTTGHGDDSRGEVIHTEPLAWVGRAGGLAHTKAPLPLALANTGCAWRKKATKELDKAGIAYRVAYTSENSSAIEAALRADLAISPQPASSIEPPLAQIQDNNQLPALGKFSIKLIVPAQASAAVEALANYIKQQYG